MVSVSLPSDALSQHLPSHLGFSYLRRGVFLHSCSSKVQSLLLTLDEVTPPDLECGVVPLGPPLRVQPPLLGCGVAPLSCCPWPQAWGNSFRLCFCAVHHSWNSERDGNTRQPDLPLETLICRSGSNSWNWTWNNRLVPNRKRSTSRLYIVTLLI